MPNVGTWSRWAWAAFAVAAGLRLLGIGWGLPHAYNADEPHLIHLAVSFGAGSLKPYAYKYPALWPYLLFACYGVYFLAWSAFGLRHSMEDFAGLYAWHPEGFFLIGRLLSFGFSLAAAAVLWRFERRRRPQDVPWAALLLLFSPLAVSMSQTAKPDSLMLFLACCGWTLALRVHEEGERRLYRLCGAAFGLAMAGQYTALPAALALPLAHFFSPHRRPLARLLEGLAACAAAFFITNPYVLLDFPHFWAALRDLGDMPPSLDRGRMAAAVLGNAWGFAGPWSLAGPAALAGLWRLWRRRRAQVAVLTGPLLAYFLILTLSPDGGLNRYLLGAYPALALLCAEGLGWAAGRGRFAAALAGLLALGPGIMTSFLSSREMALPDTRQQAETWVLKNIPPGAVILADAAHAVPRLAMSREQAREQAEFLRREGLPRWRFYHAMAESHPGGGWRVYRIQLSAKDLGSAPRHTRRSQAETPTADVREGLEAARRLGVDYVIASSHGAELFPEFAAFTAELRARARLLAEFTPVPGRLAGPAIRVYSLH